jgi:hypothetical protein
MLQYMPAFAAGDSRMPESKTRLNTQPAIS